MSLSTSEPVVDAEPSAPARTIPLTVIWVLAALALPAGGYYLDQVLTSPQTMMHLVDLGTYQIAGQRVVDGISVYDSPLRGHTRGVFEFVYTPFAALLFVPLVAMHGLVFTWIGGLLNFAMLVGSAWAALSLLGYRRDLRLLATGPLIAALLLWIEPIRSTMAFGQVNILLLLLVLVDLALPDSSRWKGALTGVAAAVKLTPVFFVLYLLATRRYRAAATAVGAIVVTVVVGAIAMWHDSLTFWGGAFADPERVGVPQNSQNESLRGMIARAVGAGTALQALWLLGAAAVTVACLMLARRLWATGRELPAVVLCGLTSTVVSPFSWTHHWVWLAPLLICLADLAIRRPGVVTAGSLAVVAVVVSDGVMKLVGLHIDNVFGLPNRPPFAVLDHNAYVWLTLAVFVGVAVGLYREPQPADTALPELAAARSAGDSGS
ncbi:glycosyltransferase 87 family protein [Nocardia aurantia]|uniref:Polyprenol-phosphate-mannose-dependent alpha-(1-2)-phosphatidylinositol mannoside mannosyltransferase n=1 Tax=Nocardia aurantia TaxID=2585199 RepID=A0A7K0DP36_9NOCA|nr:glycosyltransferase 87 family protein [Nocardia aurantia]MQY27510.1 Polyprenol-phosphate-mannose-dependent alpha-(1-2)-phosphatidylinositol mannoside mannosyltransferase [Nocardia aurantia]